MISTTFRASRQAIVTALAPLVLLAGCAGNGGGMGNVMQTDTGKGALFGGGAGALIGGLIDHSDPAVGILIGAAGGALAGGLIGHHMDTQKQNLAKVRTYGKVTITVIGHPDPGGTYSDRERLANQRAEAIRVQLLGMGVPPILVTASGNPRSTWEDGRADLMIYPVVGG